MTTDVALLDALTVDLFDEGERALASYYGRGEHPAYDGAGFERYGLNEPNRITSDDVLATTLLSIRVGRFTGKESGFTAHHVKALEDRADDLAALLTSLDVDRDLHTLAETEAVDMLAWEEGTPAYELYQLVRHGLDCESKPGRAATWKLIARKRPALLAVRDNVVSQQRLSYSGDPWWLPWWRTVAARPEIVDRLQALQATLDSTHPPPLLRIADVVLWCGDGCR